MRLEEVPRIRGTFWAPPVHLQFFHFHPEAAILFDVVLSNLISDWNDLKYPVLIHNCGSGF